MKYIINNSNYIAQMNFLQNLVKETAKERLEYSEKNEDFMHIASCVFTSCGKQRPRSKS